MTKPDFRYAFIDSPVEFALAPEVAKETPKAVGVDEKAGERTHVQPAELIDQEALTTEQASPSSAWLNREPEI